MELNVALKGMLTSEAKLRTPEGVNQPVYMSAHMMRLSQYTGAVEERLAEYERNFEVEYAHLMKEYLIDKKMKVTQAERMVDIETAELKGQIKYLTRLVSSAWRQTGIIQSRINHLVKEAGTQI